MTPTNIASAAILSATRIALSVADSRVPTSSSPATTAMIATAGRLTTPPAIPGPLASAAGMAKPLASMKPVK